MKEISDKTLIFGIIGIFGFLWSLKGKNMGSTETSSDTDYSDVNALARMLQSETSNPHAREIIGYIVIQKAKRRGSSIYNLLTQGKGWGPQDRRNIGQGIMYASTRKAASKEAKEVARRLINNEIDIPTIVKSNIGAWFEKLPSIPEMKLVDRQKSWNEGIYARITGTNWYLYSREAPKVNSLAEVTREV